jgi:hypothetical protein
MYTVRVTELQRSCKQDDTEYWTRLQHGHTRLLSTLTTIRRHEMYNRLKTNFITQPKCPILIPCFFQNESTKLWLLFLRNQLHNYTKSIQRMEWQPTSASKVANELTTTTTTGEERGVGIWLRDEFFFLYFEEEMWSVFSIYMCPFLFPSIPSLALSFPY